MSERPTPETDEAERMAFAQEYMVPTDFARRLERERDQAREERDKLKQLLAADSENVDAYLGVCTERDEAREKAERYRLEANALMLKVMEGAK